MKRKISPIEIEGTSFIVDVGRQLLLENGKPENCISFLDMRDFEKYYTLEYSRKEKNLPASFSDETVTSVIVPQMKELDPEGMKLAYGCSDDDLLHLSDFEIVVNQDIIKERLQGKQPVIDIAGHPFYIDLHSGYLRPKDDFFSKGISLARLEEIGSGTGDDNHRIAYDPLKHELVELDISRITKIPKGIIVVEIPPAYKLDPVKWAEMRGFSIRDTTREHPPLREHVARIIPWSETAVKEIIRENTKKIKQRLG